jgi:hypothetical protein
MVRVNIFIGYSFLDETATAMFSVSRDFMALKSMSNKLSDIQGARLCSAQRNQPQQCQTVSEYLK